MSMSATVAPIAPQEVQGMGKKRKDDEVPALGRPPIGKQVNVRLSPELISDLEYIAGVEDNDVSSVIRAILNDHIAEHLTAAQETAHQKAEARRKKKEG